MNTNTIDFSGVSMEISAEDLTNILLPQLVTALSTNPTLLKQLTAAVSAKQLQKARTTGNVNGRYAGGSQSGAATKINSTSGIQR